MRGLLLGAALVAAAGTAGAQSPDVKAGVDAWGRGDWRAAVDKWRPLAVAGDPDAQFNLGQAYKLGRGVPEDPAMAEGWFRRAALKGHEQAGTNYALALFQAGKRAEAAPWLEKAAARGEPRAQLVLGTMLFNGDGVKRDVPRAYALMTRASAAGLPSASQTLAQMDGYISPAERQRGLEIARTLPNQPNVVAAAEPTPAPAPSPAARLTPVRAAPKPATVATTPRPAPRPRPALVATNGRYRVQLGAFRTPGSARQLWNKVGARVGGQPSYPSAGGVTRLQAGPFPTRAAAQAACAKAGVGCMVVSS